MLSANHKVSQDVELREFTVAGELHDSGPNELVSVDDVLSLESFRAVRNIGGGIDYNIVIGAQGKDEHDAEAQALVDSDNARREKEAAAAEAATQKRVDDAVAAAWKKWQSLPTMDKNSAT